MNQYAHPFRLLSVLLSAYLLLCLCCIILNTSSAEQHRRHHFHHTASLHRHHLHHRSRNNHLHHHRHLIISSRSNSGAWQGKTPWGNRTPPPLLPNPVGLNNQFQRITLLPLPSHSGQPRPPRPHPHPQGPPPPPPLPPRPGQRQQCGENAEWVHNCKQARKVFNAAKYQRGNGCFATTCTSYLATRGNQQGDFRRWSGCFCLPSHVWLDQEVGQPPAQGAAPGQPGGRCVLPARCPAVERHLSSTPMKLSFTWTKGIARYRQWKAKKMAAGAWRSPIKPGETYVNDQRAVATSRWLVHFLALHEEDRFVRVYPEPNWPILELNVHKQMLAKYGHQWSRAFLQEYPPSLERQTTASGDPIDPDMLFYAWRKHGSAFGINFPPEAYFALVDRLYREVNLDGRLKDAGVTPSDKFQYTVEQFIEGISTGGGDEVKYPLIPEKSIRLTIHHPMICEVSICYANVAAQAYAPCPVGSSKGVAYRGNTPVKYYATFVP